MQKNIENIYDEFTDIEVSHDDKGSKDSPRELEISIENIYSDEDLKAEYKRGYEAAVLEEKKKYEESYNNNLIEAKNLFLLELENINKKNSSQLENYISFLTNKISKIILSKFIIDNSGDIKIHEELKNILSVLRDEEEIKIFGDKFFAAKIDAFVSSKGLPVVKDRGDILKEAGDFEIDWRKGKAFRKVSENLNELLKKYIGLQPLGK